jgi:hypothetical protein
MVYVMSRDPLQTVTLPVLIDAKRLEDADGWATCFPPTRSYSYRAVRVAEKWEVKKRLPDIFPSKARSQLNEKLLYVGAGLLKRAHDAKDELGLQPAVENVLPWVPVLEGHPPKFRAPGEAKWAGVRVIYSSLMSNVLQDARLVMWCSDKEGRFLPGVYCPDWKTAAFVTMVMEHIRVCPKCHQPFIPKADNVDYCTPAHGVAYRTARSRTKRRAQKPRRARKSLR